MLYELLYTSIAQQHDMPDEELYAILDSSRRNNARLDITGVLVYHRGEFAQLLEGSETAVRRLFHDVIAKDERHHSVRVFWERGIPERSFPSWRMGFARGHELPHMMEGMLEGGLRTLDFSTPASLGRRVMLAFYQRIEARRTSQA